MIVPILRVWNESRQAYEAVPAICGESVEVPVEPEEIDLSAAGFPGVPEQGSVAMALETDSELAAALTRAQSRGVVRFRFENLGSWRDPLEGADREAGTVSAAALWGGSCFFAPVGNRVFYFGLTEAGTLTAAARTLWTDESV